MENTQQHPRVGDESQSRQASTAPLSRLLANPRRVRRA